MRPTSDGHVKLLGALSAAPSLAACSFTCVPIPCPCRPQCPPNMAKMKATTSAVTCEPEAGFATCWCSAPELSACAFTKSHPCVPPLTWPFSPCLCRLHLASASAVPAGFNCPAGYAAVPSKGCYTKCGEWQAPMYANVCCALRLFGGQPEGLHGMLCKPCLLPCSSPFNGAPTAHNNPHAPQAWPTQRWPATLNRSTGPRPPCAPSPAK